MTEATDNVEFLKGMSKAFANGDVSTVLAAMDDNIEWNEAEGNPYYLGSPFVLKGGKAVHFQQYVDTLHFANALGAG